MKLSQKILLIWLGTVVASLLCYVVLGRQNELEVASFLTYALQLLLFIVSVAIARYEPTGKNRAIFINFCIFFGLAPLFHLYNFADVLLPASLVVVARLNFFQYVALGGYFFFLAFAVVYLTVDALFRDFRTFQKYFLALAIVGGFFVYYYGPFLTDSYHAYKTETAMNWKELNKGYDTYVKEYKSTPTAADLAAVIEMHSWSDGQTVGVLYPEERLRRAEALFPYLEGNNYMILLSAPLYRNVIYMNVLAVAFILLFFGYQYRKDPPQGAYIEKVMFFLLLFCSMEILHAWSFIKSVEWRTFHELASIGQYVSAAILLLISAFFAMRLKFIRSINGEFYETEIVTRPSGITRWRDWLDDLVIAHFFNRRAILGRLFVRDTPTKQG
jgi:hypothetical protein